MRYLETCESLLELLLLVLYDFELQYHIVLDLLIPFVVVKV